MTLVVLALLFVAPQPLQPLRLQRPAEIASREESDLKTRLLERLKEADAREQGLFHDEVTADVASLFPVGQPFRETQRIVRKQSLGALDKFKGESHEGTTMYVARCRLETEVLGDVYLVIDFDFDGTSEQDMRLKRVKAFLRASNM